MTAARPRSVSEGNPVHRSSVLRRLTVGAGVLALTAGLAGCTGSAEAAEPTGGLALVLGARSNMPVPTVDGAAAAELGAALGQQSQLSVVVADGRPFELDAWPLTVSDKNPQAADEDRVAHRNRINATLAQAAAVTPEVDLLSALELGVRSIDSAAGPHTLVVVDSGLSTAGPLDLTEPELVNADPAALAAGLEAAGELPDLTGVDVVFQGLGDTAPPQQPLGRAQRTNLVAIWTAIADAAGAADVQVEEAPLTGPAGEDLPEVSLVPPGTGVECSADTMVLRGGDVAFRPDSAVFVAPDAAADMLRPIAGQIVEGGLTATVTGTTARVGDLEGQRALSLERAQAVAAVLADHGVPADAMTVAGLGSEFPGYVDADPAANRKVVIQLGGGSAGVTCAQD